MCQSFKELELERVVNFSSDHTVRVLIRSTTWAWQIALFKDFSRFFFHLMNILPHTAKLSPVSMTLVNEDWKKSTGRLAWRHHREAFLCRTRVSWVLARTKKVCSIPINVRNCTRETLYWVLDTAAVKMKPFRSGDPERERILLRDYVYQVEYIPIDHHCNAHGTRLTIHQNAFLRQSAISSHVIQYRTGVPVQRRPGIVVKGDRIHVKAWWKKVFALFSSLSYCLRHKKTFRKWSVAFWRKNRYCCAGA